jgi:hypothetical protein
MDDARSVRLGEGIRDLQAPVPRHATLKRRNRSWDLSVAGHSAGLLIDNGSSSVT